MNISFGEAQFSPVQSELRSPKIHVQPTCKIHSPHSSIPKSLEPFQKSQILFSKSAEILNVVHPAAKFLSIFGSVKPRKQVTCLQNTVMGQAQVRQSHLQKAEIGRKKGVNMAVTVYSECSIYFF